MKKIIPYIFTAGETTANVIRQAFDYATNGADALFLYDYSKDEKTHEEFLLTLRKLEREVDIPFWAGTYVKRFEDVKKALYTGAKKAVISYQNLPEKDELRQASKRFGKDKMVLEVDMTNGFEHLEGIVAEFQDDFGTFLLKHVTISEGLKKHLQSLEVSFVIRDSLVRNDIRELLELSGVEALSTNYFEKKDLMKAKCSLASDGVEVNTFASSLSFADFKKNADGMVPVIAQDYKTGEVLMLAYMNEEAFEKTVLTGRMTYFSRSRNELWCKGDTSGHYQYVKELKIDCDKDTILAKVHQVGAACHTGNRTCFYTDLVNRGSQAINPNTILEEDYQVIMERKLHPKEGSYTNYLFDKGIDKILKKCGEEATEITIAAKNPEAEELKYEIADYLYHLMVLMAECDLTWEDVMKELVNRR